MDTRDFERELDAFVDGMDEGPSSQRVLSFEPAVPTARSRLADPGYPWELVRTMKRSDHELTELVQATVDGRCVRAVRKTFPRADTAVPGAGAAALGEGYRLLMDAQRGGALLGGVPWVYSCHESRDRLVVVVEYVSGSVLSEFASAFGPGRELAQLVVPALCQTVGLLHTELAALLIHRDLKPQNVVVHAGAPYVIDFGIARSWHDGVSADTSLFLTRGYAPPEQFGFGQTDERTDVYALGKMLYFCLTGSDPAAACTLDDLKDAGIPERLARVILRVCAFDPEARYTSAFELGRAADEALCALAAPAPVRISARKPASSPTPAPGSAAADAGVRSAPMPIGSAKPPRPHSLRNLLILGYCVFWAVMVIVCALLDSGSGPFSAMPVLVRVATYVFVGLPPLTFVPLAFLDYRSLLKRASAPALAWLAGLSMFKRVVLLLIAALAVSLASCCIVVACGY